MRGWKTTVFQPLVSLSRRNNSGSKKQSLLVRSQQRHQACTQLTRNQRGFSTKNISESWHSRRSFSASGDIGLIPHDATQLAVVCGPSGVGKGTLLGHLKKRFVNIAVSVSHTTRQPRPGEIDGVHYTFLSREIFEQGVTLDEYIEHSEVHGNYYGTSKTHLEKLSHQRFITSEKKKNESESDQTSEDQSLPTVVILEIDVSGAHKIQDYLLFDALNKRDIHAKYLFINGPKPNPKMTEDEQILEQLYTLRDRLITRGTETEEQIERRLQTSQIELQFLAEHPHFFDHVLYNDDLEEAKMWIVRHFLEWFPFLQTRPDFEE